MGAPVGLSLRDEQPGKIVAGGATGPHDPMSCRWRLTNGSQMVQLVSVAVRLPTALVDSTTLS